MIKVFFTQFFLKQPCQLIKNLIFEALGPLSTEKTSKHLSDLLNLTKDALKFQLSMPN